jgi:MFS family permease
MLKDLHFGEAVYGFGAGLFFLGYCACGIPVALLQQRFGARRILALTALCWGLTSAGMILVSSPTEFYVLRFLLGAFEAGFYPGVILYFASWFNARRRTRNFSIFHSAAICAPVAIGLIGGFALDHMNDWLSVTGWRWMFLLESVPTVLLGYVVLRFLPDGPQSATWLTANEQNLIQTDLNSERRSETLDPTKHSLFANPMVWLLSAAYFCILSANTAPSFYTLVYVRQ